MTTAETDRLVIRPPVEADRPRFIELFSDHDFMMFSGGVHDAEAANARFDRMLTLADAVTYGKQLIVEKATKTIVGYTGVDTVVFDGIDRLEWGWRRTSPANRSGRR